MTGSLPRLLSPLLRRELLLRLDQNGHRGLFGRPRPRAGAGSIVATFVAMAVGSMTSATRVASGMVSGKARGTVVSMDRTRA
jgi:hypothetical protein